MAKAPETPETGVLATGQKSCPVCGKPSVPSERPFCSKRCADVDLYRWLGGAYAIPGPPLAENKPSASKLNDEDD